MNSRHIFLLLVLLAACRNTPKNPPSPAGYNLGQPATYHLPNSLTEISGIAFYQGNPDTLFAEQDEEGKIYYLRPGDAAAIHTRFSKKGDYEDIAIAGDQVYILRSDGLLLSFPFAEVKARDIRTVTEWKDLLPPGEYEGLAADSAGQRLYVLCKHCPEANASKAVPVYQLAVQGGVPAAAGEQTIDVTQIESLAGKKKIRFNPSAFARQPASGNWFIVSAVNQLLVITDSSFHPLEVYQLSPAQFNQPEGIAFDRNNNLYISNEGGTLDAGNVLRFTYQPRP